MNIADCRELFETAYKWILAPPKRDVRALCATQSVPGSTKQRQKKKKKIETAPDSVVSNPPPAAPQAQQSQTNPQREPNYSPPYILIPSDEPASDPPVPNWTTRNPALAQYHQIVWQVQQQNPNFPNSGDPFAVAMQRIKATPVTSASPVQTGSQNPLPPKDRGPEIVLPPPEFNLGQPPPTLLHAGEKKELPIAPRPPPANSPNLVPQTSNAVQPYFPHEQPDPATADQGMEWRDQFASQFYRTPVSISPIPSHPQLPKLMPRPLAPISSPASQAPQSIPQFHQVPAQYGNTNPDGQNWH